MSAWWFDTRTPRTRDCTQASRDRVFGKIDGRVTAVLADRQFVRPFAHRGIRAAVPPPASPVRPATPVSAADFRKSRRLPVMMEFPLLVLLLVPKRLAVALIFRHNDSII